MMLLEALAVGTVGVASDIPENTSILPAGYPTFAAGDAADLRRHLEKVLDWDDARRGALERRGREWVREHHDWDRIAGRYEALYRQAEAWGGAEAGRATEEVVAANPSAM